MVLLFDLDGTLLDTAPDFLYALNQLRVENHLAPISSSLLSDIKHHVSNGTEALLSHGLGLTVNDPHYESQAKRFLSIYREHLGQHTQHFPGIPMLLSLLEDHQIPWGIVTNKPQWLTEPLLKFLNLDKRAACIISGDTTPYLKPHPAPLLLASKQINVNPQLCIYIGDAERDIVAGKAAGMATIAALFGYINSIEEALQWDADHYVKHPDEIWPWILKKIKS